MDDLRKAASRSTRLDDIIMQSPLLHWSEKLLYYSIKSQISQQKGVRNGEFSASKETLAESVGLSVRTIQRLLKKWREAGYLAVKEANRFKPVKYELLEHVLRERVAMPSAGERIHEMARPDAVQVRPLVVEVGHAAPSIGHTVTEVSQPDRLVGQQVVKVGHQDHLVGQPVINVGQVDASGEKSRSPERPGGDVRTAGQTQDWRTPELDEIVMEMGRKMNEISTDIMGRFVVDERWLRFLTRDEYSNLVKISRDIRRKSGS